MKLSRILLGSTLALATLVLVPDIARADCAGPTIEYEPTEVVRGGLLTVTGTGFGDNCYDTGPPPEGEGVLGNPLTEIEIHLVQGDDERLVATGSADEEYGFRVDVIVPASFTPGAMSITVDVGPAFAVFASPEDPLVVTEAAPVESLGAEVAMFGPLVESGLAPTDLPVDDSVDGPDDDSGVTEELAADVEDEDSSPLVIVGAVAIVALLAAGGWLALRRQT
ncbi:hypothetical protein [Actinospongicola halichondriae]|uniref:hypothetical protein n=1 Tax=Actinospongicola halichondriae TaxID=3236844 RepID=UPI003D593F16